jgi:flagellar biogenesis protein FliO
MTRRALFLVFLVGLLLWPGAVQARRSQSALPVPVASPGGESEGAAALPTPQNARAAAERVAGDVPEYRLPEAESERSLFWEGTRMVLSLAAVLLILGLGVKAVRRWPGLVGREASAGPLELLGRLPLTTKEALCLVRAGGALLVVGVSPSGVTLLHRLDGEAEVVGRAAGVGSAARGTTSAPVSPFRLRELAARVRDVQASWRSGGGDRGEAR